MGHKRERVRNQQSDNIPKRPSIIPDFRFSFTVDTLPRQTVPSAALGCKHPNFLDSSNAPWSVTLICQCFCVRMLPLSSTVRFIRAGQTRRGCRRGRSSPSPSARLEPAVPSCCLATGMCRSVCGVSEVVVMWDRWLVKVTVVPCTSWYLTQDSVSECCVFSGLCVCVYLKPVRTRPLLFLDLCVSCTSSIASVLSPASRRVVDAFVSTYLRCAPGDALQMQHNYAVVTLASLSRCLQSRPLFYVVLRVTGTHPLFAAVVGRICAGHF